MKKLLGSLIKLPGRFGNPGRFACRIWAYRLVSLDPHRINLFLYQPNSNYFVQIQAAQLAQRIFRSMEKPTSQFSRAPSL